MGNRSKCATCGSKIESEMWVDGGKDYCSRSCMYHTSFSSPESSNVPYIIGDDDSTWNGVYENITSEPVTIRGGRRELIEVCNKHGVAAKALLKPKSQGSGYEMQTRRFQ